MIKATKRRGAPKGPRTKAKAEFDFMPEFKDRLEKEIERQDMSYRALSHKAGLGNSTTRHLLKAATDVSLETIYKLARALGIPPTWLAFGVHGYDSDNAIALGMSVLRIFGPHEAEAEKPAQNLGFIAVEKSKYPPDARAMLVEETAMTIDRINEPVPPEQVILAGDVVIWSRSAPFLPGEVVVGRTKNGHIVRRLVEGAGGKPSLVANNTAYVAISVPASDVRGKVLAVFRRTTK